MRKVLLPLLALALGSPMTAAIASGGGDGAGELHLVPMDEIRVPIVDGGRSDGTLRLKLTIEAKDAAAAEELAANLPVLRAASLGAALEFARLHASPMTPVDVERLSAELAAALRAEEDAVARPLIVEVAAVPA